MPTRSCLNCAVRGPQSFCSLSTLAILEMEAIGNYLCLDAHTTLLHEGFSADRVFVLCSGRVKLCASSPDGRLLLLRVAGLGDVLGLASLLRGENSLYRVTAETLEPCEVKSIARAQFIRFMDSSHEVSHAASSAIAREYDSVLLSARRLALSSSAAGKLASALLDWARLGVSPGLNPNAPLTFLMPLTHEELGSLAGLSRETVTRLLGKFRREGLIEIADTQMVLRKPAQLESLYS